MSAEAAFTQEMSTIKTAAAIKAENYSTTLTIDAEGWA
jgi:hypothetical protein